MADNVFVGTIDEVVEVDEPVYLRDWDLTTDTERFTKLGSVRDCPSKESLQRAVRFDFVDVETLSGEALPTKFSITMGGDFVGEYPGVGFREGNDYPTDIDGKRVYFPGSRIGAALFRDSTGEFHWNYRQFEVLSGQVELQAINRDAMRSCWTEPMLLGIPDQYQGVSIADFKTAIASVPTTLSMAQLDAIDARHSFFVDDLERDNYRLANNTYCRPKDPEYDEDPSIPNDPAASP